MKTFSNILAILTLALTFGLSDAARIANQRRGITTLSARAECDNSEFVECIVSLAELPLQITTCIEALDDIGKVLNSQEDPPDPIAVAAQGADCIAEATLAAIELPSHCSGCLAALDGECPHAEIPCTGPPPSSGKLPGRR
ncbi:hypothetical protein D9757_000955 [Collybiopsis confluens]|uniref:Fungal calcium binding protein domain-containing protein n=1 Tax=Collybiopsis confluens TaxID=2823264 RepID=A0A8H5I0M9_9AGAR|nr:hypothetical protein D9757_000955 [Collybiopsis confluens]